MTQPADSQQQTPPGAIPIPSPGTGVAPPPGGGAPPAPEPQPDLTQLADEVKVAARTMADMNASYLSTATQIIALTSQVQQFDNQRAAAHAEFEAKIDQLIAAAQASR